MDMAAVAAPVSTLVLMNSRRSLFMERPLVCGKEFVGRQSGGAIVANVAAKTKGNCRFLVRGIDLRSVHQTRTGGAGWRRGGLWRLAQDAVSVPSSRLDAKLV